MRYVSLQEEKDMLTTNFLLAEKYNYLDEKFKRAFEFLRETNLDELPVGNIPIDGDEIYANVQSYITMPNKQCPFESHCSYIDIQYMVSGEEVFGYEPVNNLVPFTEYNLKQDIIFYEEPKESGLIVLRKGDFAIVPPEDGHAPRRMSSKGPCPVKKIVIKIKV